MIASMLHAALQAIRPTLAGNDMLYAPHRDEILRVCGEMEALVKRLGEHHIKDDDFACVPRFMVTTPEERHARALKAVGLDPVTGERLK